jgi:beta-glucanase (GH16 family)
MFRFAFIVLALALSAGQASGQDWELVWSDEFDADSIDASKWQHEVNARGGGNSELQFYTDRPENSFVDGGALVIVAREEMFTGDDGTREFTSARLRTKRMGDWTYGRFEVRARMPEGQGLWPAIWLLSTDRDYGVWAASGEIDIVEMIGQKPEEAVGTLHYGRPFPQNTFSGAPFRLPEGTFADDFHTFTVEWLPGRIRWFVDDSLYQEQTSWFSSGGDYPAPFNRRFHMIINLAVGGDFPGPPDASTALPKRLEVDYVRVYQETGKSPSVRIEEPETGSNFEPGATISISAEAGDLDGNVSSVIFEQGEAILARIQEPPFEFSIAAAQSGCYNLLARVMDDEGRVAEDGPLSFSVGDECGRGPYLVRAHEVPGRIEAEHFDLGGDGIAYSDTEARNIGLEMRASEGVDIEYTADAGRGYNVGWIEVGEWLRYTVDVLEPGVYEVAARVASEQAGGRLAVEVGGNQVSGRFAATGGWQNWTTATLGRINLEAGVQDLRLMFESSSFNLNWIRLERTGDPTASVLELPNESILQVEAYPNPLSDVVRVRVSAAPRAHLNITVVDLLGRPVTRIFNGAAHSGIFESDVSLDALPYGAYVLRVESDGRQVHSTLLTKL